MGSKSSKPEGQENKPCFLDASQKRREVISNLPDESEHDTDSLKAQSEGRGLKHVQFVDKLKFDWDDRPSQTNPAPPKTLEDYEIESMLGDDKDNKTADKNVVWKRKGPKHGCVQFFRKEKKETNLEPEPPKHPGADKAERWQKQTWKVFSGPLPPLVSTSGIDDEETVILSKVIHEATQEACIVKTSDNPASSEEFKVTPVHPTKKPFIMIHQTNEQEIMKTQGSFRLNQWLNVKTDINSVSLENSDDSIFMQMFNIISHERNRRWYAYRREHESLTLEEAYLIGNGGYLPGETKRFGIAEVARKKISNTLRINMIPVVHSHQPVIGVPFKGYLRDIVELPECSMEFIQIINQHLMPHGLQVIDLRRRSEEVLGQPPLYHDDYEMANHTIDAISRSVEALNSIKNTAKYFIVYAIYADTVPMYIYQAIVRFKPGLPINSADWIDDGKSRLEIEEPDMEPVNTLDSVCWLMQIREYRYKVAAEKSKYEKELKQKQREEQKEQKELKRQQCEELKRQNVKKQQVASMSTWKKVKTFFRIKSN
ncbi:Rhodanese domain-containing protein [Caenorhabditis elegans]|uniref:Rhodanese domain-containing protein n=1 Tax=Caenorhabditis elegans TaxID=6239 RepID=Q20425_CAEEL|nr:Rhodanese domain-containing protein [Caenorhabditis elegans]CCD66640.1 Rhodanese domain-containing protein [Caenorhabditis elegans]|eukprot:NP_509343.2 Uncharacterized protein CELE_F45E1.5 [Caenorhabditis elegans]